MQVEPSDCATQGQGMARRECMLCHGHVFNGWKADIETGPKLYVYLKAPDEAAQLRLQRLICLCVTCQ